MQEQPRAPLKGEPYKPTIEELDRCMDFFLFFWRQFKNRKILLVGGSLSVDKLDLKEYDYYDVVQLNHHLQRRPQQRCEWLIARAGSGMDLQLLKTLPQYRTLRLISTACHKHTFKQFLDAHYTVWPFHEHRYIGPNPYHPGLEWCNQFWNELRTNPTIGMLALRMIQLLPVREIRLIGFDFWHDKTKGFESLRSGCHYLPGQIEWLRHQYHTDFRIQLEDRLLELLDIKKRGYFGTAEIAEPWVKKV